MGDRKEIGGYQLLEQIGYGGMSTVYKAQDGAGNYVALKLLHPALADSAGRERLSREVSMLLRVKGSRVAQVLDAETEAEDAFIVTELIDGPTLEQDVAENGVYEGEELAELAEELTQAIRSIHAAEVLHRDLKPSNVMMSEDGPVLIDFGIAQLGDDTRLTKVGSLAQTPGYCDPRVVRGDQPDEEADWWALAAVLLFAATGRSPFGTGTTDVILRRVLDGHADVSGLDKPIAQAFLAALVPHNRIDTETLTEVLRHPENAHKLLPSRSENPTQMLAYEKTRVYETVPEPVEQAEEQAALTEVIAHDATEIVDTQSVAGQYDTELLELPQPTQQTELLPREYVPEQELAPTMPYGQPVMNGAGAENASGDTELVDSGDEYLTEPVPQWARKAPKSSWLVLLIGLALSVYGSVWIGVGLSLYALFLVVCSTWGLVSGELRERRLERGGIYPHDRLGAFVRLPWALIRAVLLSAVSLVVGALAFGLIFLLLRNFVADIPLIPQSSGEKIPLPHAALVGIAFFVLLLVSWLFVSNRRGREGARSCLKSLAPSAGYTFFWTIILIIGIGIGVVLVGNTPYVDWFPLPDVGGTLPRLFGTQV
ncbi:MAG: protein kinase [Actinomycetaceae bacterium]|nr:protein kinase [Actinomycetaceae bacterium]